MRKEYFVTGLDIGSSKVTALTARADVDGALEIVGQVSLPSKGVARGAFTNLGEATDSVSKAMSRLREKTARRIGDIYVNISGETVRGSKSVGMIPIALRGREIVGPDMDRCVSAASTIHLPFDREIIDRVVHSFSIDDQPHILNPLGLYASRLSCQVYIITADVNHIQNIYKCVNSAGHDIKELVFTGVADGASLLDGKLKEEGVALIDLGDSLIESSLFFNGSLAEFGIYPMAAMGPGSDFRQDADFGATVSRIAARMQDFIRSGGRISSVVLTGGMSFADGIVEFLEARLPYPIRMGMVKNVRGDISSIDSIRLSTAIGLARYGMDKHERKLAEGRNTAERLSNKIVEIFNHYF